MLQCWTIQKLVAADCKGELCKYDPIDTLMRLRIEEDMKHSLFYFKQWIDYCPCGCDQYSSRVQVAHDLGVKYHYERIQAEKVRLGLDVE